MTLASCLENESLQNFLVIIEDPVSNQPRKYEISSKITYEDYKDELKRQNEFVYGPEKVDLCIITLNVARTGILFAKISYDVQSPIGGDHVTAVSWGPTRIHAKPTFPSYAKLEIIKKQLCCDALEKYCLMNKKLTWSNKVFCLKRTSAQVSSTSVSNVDFGGPVLNSADEVIGILLHREDNKSSKNFQQLGRLPIPVLRLGFYKQFIKRYITY
ncbi:hypothetical protein QAD02_009866 [Eretmocerus hayati]|uniref:Uncharacterized protein n=1 Tax=Eretmocerus hayati TaxID=131215 RepID=A0ACC2NB92_9HYME|nr:hypothetical protein QAD02_009866 [Eretmocerus hayati]